MFVISIWQLLAGGRARRKEVARAPLGRNGMDASDARPEGRAKNVHFVGETLAVDMIDGRRITVPLVWYPKLLAASAEQRRKWTITGGGNGIHWPDLGETVSMEGLLQRAPATLAVRLVYLCGLGFWIVMWAVILWWIFRGTGPQGLAKVLRELYSGKRWLLSIPGFIGSLVLGVNLCLWWRPKGFTTYKTEVRVIEFVERNSSWFLVASGTLLTAASLFLTRPTLDMAAKLGELPVLAKQGLVAVVVFESVSLFWLFLVVSLYWVPPDPKELVFLRHLKTLPFSYGVSFFAAAISALLAAVMSYY
jgi:hypothetical protein